MKVQSKYELTTAVNKDAKVRKRKIPRAQFLKMLRDSQKYSILVRIASELYRAGIRPGYFLQHLHKEDWSLSTRVMEELERIDRGRNGYDPDKVPPMLPVYLRPLSDEEADDQKRVKGRPTRKKAADVFLKWVKHVISEGWTEADIANAYNDILDDSDEEIMVVAPDPDLIVAKPVKPAPAKRSYYVHDGKDWQVFESPQKAKSALAKLKDTVMGTIRDTEPMPDITARICSVCHQPLNGNVMTLRTKAPETKRGKRKLICEHMHMNCWWLSLKQADVCRIPLNMEVINPTDGKTRIWHGPEKGGWKMKHETETPRIESPAPVPSASPARVPGASSQQPAAVVPTPPKA